MERSEALEKLNEEFKSHLQADRENGLVDLKALCRIGEDTSTHEYVWTLNNALKVSKGDNVETFSAAEVDQALEQFIRQ